MVVGVKQLSSKHFKGYCRSCRKVLVNGQVVAFVDGTSPLRCHHLDCHWRCSRLQKHFSAGAPVLIDSSVSDEDRVRVKARLALAVCQAEVDQQHEARRQLVRRQQQLVRRQQLLRDYPIGCRLVHTYDDTRVCFCEVLSYSSLGNSVRLRQVESIAVDTWNEQKQYFHWRSMTTEVHKRVCVLRRAQWDRKTDVIYNVRTCHFGDRLARGSDFEGRAIEYDPAAISAATEVSPPEPGIRVVNVRSLAGSLWLSSLLGPDLTVAQVEGRVGNAIGLLPSRGTVQLTHGGRVLDRAECLASLCNDADAPVDLVAVASDDAKWPSALDGRPMPYAHAHRVCGESLAFDVYTAQVPSAYEEMAKRRKHGKDGRPETR
jgi:hypothetical protein